MANNYDFMLKFIIVGDSSNPPSTQVSASPAFCSGLPREGSSLITSPRLEWSSARETSPSAI